MLNAENVGEETAAEYIALEGFAPIERDKKGTEFGSPFTQDGKPNLFKPYIYTYFGKRDYVYLLLKQLKKRDRIKELFQTLYLNPYSHSSVTWKAAFSKI
jgi:hypothetical protein